MNTELERQIEVLGQVEFAYRRADGMFFVSMERVRRFEIAEDCYIRPRPDVPHSFVLIDDLTWTAIDDLRRDGLNPALVIETSDGNFQAVLKLSHLPLDRQTRKTAARVLAEKYDGDFGSADADHFFRAAGSVNRKPGRQNFVVRLVEASGCVASAGTDFLDRCCPEPRPESLQTSIVAGGGAMVENEESGRAWLGARRGVVKFLGQTTKGDLDQSRIDSMTAVRLRVTGWTQELVFSAMLSANAKRENHSHEDYCARTVEWAFCNSSANEQCDRLSKYAKEFKRLEKSGR